MVQASRKYHLSAPYLPEPSRILLDSSLPEKKRRWNLAHEIGHQLTPWHDDLAYGDNRFTLPRVCWRQIEVEANFATAGMLFLGKRFWEEARSLHPSIESVLELDRRFGNTIKTTLHRLVESPRRGPSRGRHHHKTSKQRAGGGCVRRASTSRAFHPVRGILAQIRKRARGRPVRRGRPLLRWRVDWARRRVGACR